MKREIFFRAQRVDNKEWIEGDLIHAVDGLFVRQQNKPNLNFPIISKINSETVGQFTGLTDKNGTKIFEGDIINYKFYNYNGKVIEEGTYEVYFDNELLEFGLKMTNILFECQFSDEFEVIGNIFDSPELLK